MLGLAWPKSGSYVIFRTERNGLRCMEAYLRDGRLGAPLTDSRARSGEHTRECFGNQMSKKSLPRYSRWAGVRPEARHS